MKIASKLGLAAVGLVSLLASWQALNSFGFYIDQMGYGQLALATFLLWSFAVAGCVTSCVLALMNARRGQKRAAVWFSLAALVLGGWVIFVPL